MMRATSLLLVLALGACGGSAGSAPDGGMARADARRGQGGAPADARRSDGRPADAARDAGPGGFDARGDGPGRDGPGRDGPSDGPLSDDAPPGVTSIKLRLVAANLSSGSGQSYDLGHGQRILQGIHPDVVMIQELNVGDGSDAALRGWVDTTLGPEFHVHRETGAQIPNGILSRHRIAEAGQWTDPRVSNRAFAWARIDLPGPRDLWVVSVHLLTSSGTERNQEAAALVTAIQGAVPSEAYLAIGGDFNTTSHDEACLDTLGPVASHPMPYPADARGNTSTNGNRTSPHDHVLADADLTPHAIPVVIGASTFPGGAVIDTRIYDPLADLAPAMMNDSGAPSMQHMAVVRDFDVPVR